MAQASAEKLKHTRPAEKERGFRRGSHSDSAGGTAPRVRAAKSSELG